MTDWTEAELAALKRAYAAGRLKVAYGQTSVTYGSAEDLLSRVQTIERTMMVTAGQNRAIAGVAGFRRGEW